MGTQYGIKDVADVTFYDLATGKPVLYLDSLRIGSLKEIKIEHTVDEVDNIRETKITIDKASLDKGQLSLLLGKNIVD